MKINSRFRGRPFNTIAEIIGPRVEQLKPPNSRTAKETKKDMLRKELLPKGQCKGDKVGRRGSNKDATASGLRGARNSPRMSKGG